MNESPTAAELEDVPRFVKRFVPKRRQARWLTVLEGTPSKWSRIDVDDLLRAAEENDSIRPTYVEEEIEAPDLAGNPSATLFRLSRRPYLLRGPVRDLVDEVVDDDALLVVHQGRVVLASHHSSGWVVCRGRKSNASK